MDTLFTDGHFWIGPTDTDWQNELFVSQGLVATRTQNNEDFSTVKLGGRYIYPSFRDGHAHPLQAAREHFGPRLTGLTSISEIVDTLARFSSDNPELDWIVGGTYDRDLVPDGKFEAVWLDEAVSERPVVLHSSDHHALWLNTEALRRADLLLSQPALESGSIDVDDDGRATGVVREWPAMNTVLRNIPAATQTRRLEELAWAQNEMLQNGITEVQDAWVDEVDLSTYLVAASAGLLKVRTHLAIVLNPETWQSELSRLQTAMDNVAALANPKLVLNAAKIFLDGSFGNGTAALLEPYQSDAFGSGELLWQQEDLIELLQSLRSAGLQPHLHAIGDAAVRLALDCLEQAQATDTGRVGLPAVIAHCELIADSDIHRFRELSVISNLQPLWARPDEMLIGTLAKLGSQRVRSLYRLREIVDSGAILSFGSDWPVSDLSPLAGIATAVTRQTPDGQPEGGWTPEQRLTLPEALMSYSAGTATQLGATAAGGLEIGEPADLQVLDKNVFGLPPLDLPNLKVQAVYVAGEPIYLGL